jgi:hypothetical protein
MNFKKNDVVKVPKEYMATPKNTVNEELKMVRKVYKLNGVRMLEVEGKIFTQNIPADVCEMWIKAK